MVILNPFQKNTIFIPCYFEEDIVKVKDDYEVEWALFRISKNLEHFRLSNMC